MGILDLPGSTFGPVQGSKEYLSDTDPGNNVRRDLARSCPNIMGQTRTIPQDLAGHYLGE